MEATALKPLIRRLAALAIVLLPRLAPAQCTPPPIPASAATLPPYKEDSASFDAATTHFLCEYSTLYYADLAADTIYMGGSSTLVIAACQDLTIYMEANCTLEINPVTSTPKHIRALIVRPICVSFQDTSGAAFDTVITCSPLTYDFSQFPGGVNPCAALDATEPDPAAEAWTASPNPFAGTLVLDLPGMGKARPFRLLNALGATVLEGSLRPGQAQTLDVAALPAGFYTLLLQSGDAWRSRKVAKIHP